MTTDDADRWDSFVREHPDGTFYHLSGWRRVIGAFLKHPTFYLLVERNASIEAILPLARVRSRLFGDALISLPFLVYGGPLGRTREAVELLLKHAKTLAEDLAVDYLELRSRKPQTDWPAKDNYVTFKKSISPDIDTNLKSIPRKQRAVIRKSIKAGLVAEFDEDADRLYDILSECKRNLGTPFFSRAYLRFVNETFQNNCEILTVTRGGRVLSSVMSFRFRNEILPYYGGGGHAARLHGANDFMYWKVLESACERGIEVFDFGRSRKGTGAYNFKRYWAFEPQQLNYETYLVRAHELNRIDPENSKFNPLVRVWSRLPLPVARVAGPPIARLLG